MRVPADKHIGLAPFQSRLYASFIPLRMTADMRHVDAHAFANPLDLEGHFLTNLIAIYVSVNRSNGLEVGKPLIHFQRSEVACMPDLITLAKVVKEHRIQEAVRIGQ